MSRQYFADTLAETMTSPSAAVTSTAETTLWTTAIFTPIFAYDARPGKIYKVTAGGMLTMFTSTATITLTPRIGTTVLGGTTLGASLALATNTAFTSPWSLDFYVVWRAIGAPGVNSTLIGHGLWIVNSSTTFPGGMFQTLGGTLATADASINQGINIGVALSTGSMTTNFAFIQSFN